LATSISLTVLSTSGETRSSSSCGEGTELAWGPWQLTVTEDSSAVHLETRRHPEEDTCDSAHPSEEAEAQMQARSKDPTAWSPDSPLVLWM
jgi:hypothetical protein